jgi:hypothetical protein
MLWLGRFEDWDEASVLVGGRELSVEEWGACKVHDCFLEGRCGVAKELVVDGIRTGSAVRERF